MIDTTKPEWSEYDLMVNKLPYTLTEGVVAARQGLYLSPSWSGIIELYCATDEDESWVIPNDTIVTDDGNALWPWPDAADRLRYREGKPWATVSDRDDDMPVACGYGDPREWGGTDATYTLHRLAAILCDDAEAFRVLHWCVHNLCKEGTK